MVDSRQKGARGEYLARDLLRQYSGYTFERVPSSGALSYLKGDLFIPDHICNFLVEVKNYDESHFSDKILTNKSNLVLKWWEKAIEQASYKDQKPLVIFKYNRSKLFVLTDIRPENSDRYFHMPWINAYLMLLEEWLESEKLEWVKAS